LNANGFENLSKGFGSKLIDSDQEVRSAVELIFELFRQTGSAYGVVRHFAQHRALSRRVLEVLQPEQFQIALRAVNELQERSQAIDRQWRLRIERLDYQAQLAQRRYSHLNSYFRLIM
jgi:hypothetical protein